ncbi:hypothetical protein NMY22_g17816 [Coprinellus aureogranulatus]|nr:hypothetical protein NMY22_g17816 [Coprinellus aureogranulatus]
MPQIADLAIESITRFGMKAVEMVNLGKSHGVSMWLKAGYTALVSDTSEVSLPELSELGWETAFRVLWARDQVAKAQALPKGEGYWIQKEKISCGTCWRNWGTIFPIDESSSSCVNCGSDYGYVNHGVHVTLPYTSLTATIPRSTADAKSRIVVEKVVEVFGEELKDAERNDSMLCGDELGARRGTRRGA